MKRMLINYIRFVEATKSSFRGNQSYKILYNSCIYTNSIIGAQSQSGSKLWKEDVINHSASYVIPRFHQRLSLQRNLI